MKRRILMVTCLSFLVSLQARADQAPAADPCVRKINSWEHRYLRPSTGNGGPSAPITAFGLGPGNDPARVLQVRKGLASVCLGADGEVLGISFCLPGADRLQGSYQWLWLDYQTLKAGGYDLRTSNDPLTNYDALQPITPDGRPDYYGRVLPFWDSFRGPEAFRELERIYRFAKSREGLKEAGARVSRSLRGRNPDAGIVLP